MSVISLDKEREVHLMLQAFSGGGWITGLSEAVTSVIKGVSG